MSTIDDGGPAFAHGDPTNGGHPGMSLRQWAAVQLRVPDSGLDWLDAMIERARRDDAAEKALAHTLTHHTDARNGDPCLPAGWAYELADAMRAARKVKP